MASHLCIVHDVLGTCFSLSKAIEVFQSHFTDQLPKDEQAAKGAAEIAVLNHFHSAQRDFTYLSMIGNYTPIKDLLIKTLPRSLLQAGLLPRSKLQSGQAASPELVEEIRAIAAQPGKADELFKEEIELFTASLQALEGRPGMVEAFSKTYRDPSLRPSNIDTVSLWGATNGGIALAEKLFKHNLGLKSIEIDSASSNRVESAKTHIGLWSCDEIKVAKPDPQVYKDILKTVLPSGDDDSKTSKWFVASHMWDLQAAKAAGFKTLWVSYEEFSPCVGVFDAPDLVALDLEEGAKKILEWERNHGS